MAIDAARVVRVRIKICGITRPEDAEAAVEAGADALGFVLWDGSPRRLTAERAEEIAAVLPPWIARVGVFVDAPLHDLVAAVARGRLTAAQLHGSEDPDYCRRLPVAWYRAFRLASAEEAGRVADAVVASGSRTFLLDAGGGPAPGGTGRTVDWRAAARIAMRTCGLSGEGAFRMVLAGGLTPDNVGRAIRMVRPWAVDVATGVERSAGVKDAALVRAFVQAVRDAS